MEVDWTQSTNSIKVAGACLVVLLLLMLLGSVFSRSADVQVNVKDLIQQCAQLAEVAKQDNDRSIALQHSTQALTMLSIARKLASDASILSHTGVNVAELERLLVDLQASCISKLEHRSPSLTNVVAGYVNL